MSLARGCLRQELLGLSRCRGCSILRRNRCLIWSGRQGRGSSLGLLLGIHDTPGRFFKGKVSQSQRGEHEEDHEHAGCLVEKIGRTCRAEQGLTPRPSEHRSDIGTLARLQEYGNDQQDRYDDMNS